MFMEAQHRGAVHRIGVHTKEQVAEEAAVDAVVPGRSEAVVPGRSADSSTVAPSMPSGSSHSSPDELSASVPHLFPHRRGGTGES